MSDTTPIFSEDDIIHTYSRAEALADGVLMDVTRAASRVGFRLPTAITAEAWNACVGDGDDGSERLDQLMHKAMQAVFLSPKDIDQVYFDCADRADPMGRRTITLKLQVHPGDRLEPVMTLMLDNQI